MKGTKIIAIEDNKKRYENDGTSLAQTVKWSVAGRHYVQRPCVEVWPVSYTHLDVYKRQPY